MGDQLSGLSVEERADTIANIENATFEHIEFLDPRFEDVGDGDNFELYDEFDDPRDEDYSPAVRKYKSKPKNTKSAPSPSTSSSASNKQR